MERSLLLIGVSSIALVVSATGFQASREDSRLLERRLLGAESMSRGLQTDLGQRLGDLEGVLLGLSGGPKSDELSDRIGVSEASLNDLRSELDQREERLRRLDFLRQRLEREDPDEKLEAMAVELAAERDELEELALQALELAREGRLEVERLERELENERQAIDDSHDSELLWDRLLAPVVQLAGPTSVGSGVLLESKPHPDGEGSRTFLLTAWHVVRDMQSDPSRMDAAVPVQIYLEDGSLRHEIGRTLCRNVDLDVCLVELLSRTPVPRGARLAGRERVAGARAFEEICAVGCPLGTDPVPSFGQISSASHLVDGAKYWMINAPTYIGNSGGGIFDADSYELLGVFSKIYNHGTARPTIVPHMGLVMPIDAVYEWLESVGYGSDGEGGLTEL